MAGNRGNERGLVLTKRKALALILIMALLFSAEAGIQLVNLAVSYVMYLPYIVIQSDGSIEPQTEYIKQNGNVYTLIGNLELNYAVKIECSNIIFDGGGHVINGTTGITGFGPTRGLMVEGVTNVTVKNIEVYGFLGSNILIENVSKSVFLRVNTQWLDLENSNFNTIAESNLGDELRPFLISYSNNNTIIKNNISFLVSDFSYNNTWDNGSVGNFWIDNYWSGYVGVDENGDGISDTPYVIDADNQDRYPLMNPWDPVIPFDTVPPSILVSSPIHKVYNVSSVPLTFLIYEASSSMSYCLDGQENVSISGNATLSGLPNGSHNLKVYVTDNSGNTGVSNAIYFSVEVPFPTLLVIAVTILVVAVVVVGLLVYFKKRKH